MSINGFSQLGLRSAEESALRLGRVMNYKTQFIRGQANKPVADSVKNHGNNTLNTDEWVRTPISQPSNKPKNPFVTTCGVEIPYDSLKDIVSTSEKSPAKITLVENSAGQFKNGGIYQNGDQVHIKTVKDILNIANGSKTYPS